MYAWATPDYMLNHMTIEQIFLYYEYGYEHEENKFNILTNRIAIGLFGAKENNRSKRRIQQQSPDKQAFYEQYGNQIKRGEVMKK